MLSDDGIGKLSKENNIIVNTEVEQDTYRNKPCFYVDFSINRTRRNNTIYVFGFSPGEFNSVINIYGSYVCCNAPFFLFRYGTFYYTTIL